MSNAAPQAATMQSIKPGLALEQSSCSGDTSGLTDSLDAWLHCVASAARFMFSLYKHSQKVPWRSVPREMMLQA